MKYKKINLIDKYFYIEFKRVKIQIFKYFIYLSIRKINKSNPNSFKVNIFKNTLSTKLILKNLLYITEDIF